MGDHHGSVRSRHVLVVALAVVLLATACGGDDGDDATTEESSTTTTEAADPSTTEAVAEETTTTTAAPELTASHRGVTAETITVGVSLLDMDWLAENNFIPAGWGDQELIWTTYFDDLNARGGINGRLIEPIIDFYNPIGTVGAEELCVKFTEDVEVFAILGGFLGPAEPAMTCVAQQEDLVLVGGVMSDEVLTAANAAWYIAGRSKARTIPIFLDLLDEEGRLEGRSVAVVSGDENQLDTDNILLPALAERGVEVVVDATNDTIGTDIPAEDALWDVIAERIRDSSADVIIVNGDTTSAIRGISRNGLDQEVWAVDAGQLASLGESVTKEEADGVITISGLTARESWDDPLMSACRQVFVDAHPEIEVKDPDEIGVDDEEWLTSIGQACGHVPLFELLATDAGPDLTPDSIRAAADAVGDFALPAGPNASLGPGKPDAGDSARLTVWDSTDGDDGGLVALTELVDVTP